MGWMKIMKWMLFQHGTLLIKTIFGDMMEASLLKNVERKFSKSQSLQKKK